MKLKTRSVKKRDLKALQKQSETDDAEASSYSQVASCTTKPNLEDIIICQICKDQVDKDHKMCPKCSCIWCSECIQPCFSNKKSVNCPNCRGTIHKKSLKKLPLFEKLKEFFQDVTTFPPAPKVTGCPIHNLPDEYYCKECDILCCSRCALLSESHKTHSFVSLEDIFKVKKESILQLQEKLRGLAKQCQNLLDASSKNVGRSKKHLSNLKGQFERCAKDWIDQFEAKFNTQLEAESNCKNSIEELLTEAKAQNIEFQNLLERDDKANLIRSYNEVAHNARGILVKQDNLKVSKVVGGEDIENHFLPKYTAQECAIPSITNETPEDQYLYSQEFVVVKDKFKLGAKVIQEKNTKKVQISLRIYKPNAREKQYQVLLYHPKSGKLMDEFFLYVDKQKQAEKHILTTIAMNNNFEELKSDDGRLIFQIKVRPASYLQVTLDQQDYIEQLERGKNEPLL
ncbi:unnamed protein product [Moneuplotes crassus]|uniref:Uncharacterized protein n=1 Tax=Euplotes crassus TaxID=5936 RepID=A0AAD1UI37_EUPCR|nr:unnamed protein product [Moneuplotes crassus]